MASFGAHVSCDMFKAGTGAGHRNTREGSLDPDSGGILTRWGRDLLVLNTGVGWGGGGLYCYLTGNKSTAEAGQRISSYRSKYSINTETLHPPKCG